MLKKEPYLKPLGPLEQKISDYLEPILALEGCEIITLKITGQKGQPRLALFLDRSSLDELATLSRLVSDSLDVANAQWNWFPGRYQLELSSPGIDRPLTRKNHFLSAKGEKVRVKTVSGTFNEVLRDVEKETGILLENQQAWVPWNDIREANIVYTRK